MLQRWEGQVHLPAQLVRMALGGTKPGTLASQAPLLKADCSHHLKVLRTGESSLVLPGLHVKRTLCETKTEEIGEGLRERFQDSHGNEGSSEKSGTP